MTTHREGLLGVLLAGGLSRRMGGGDKGLMPLGDKPLMQHSLERLRRMTGSAIINANGDPSRFSRFDAPIVPDTISGFAGPLAGVLAGMQYAQGHPRPPHFVVTAAADTPFFPETLADRLLAAQDQTDQIVLAQSDGRRHPVFGLWPVDLAEDLEEWLTSSEERKVLAWVDRHRWTTADFDDVTVGTERLDPFFNVNTPDDFARAQTLFESVEA
ncbi:MAG: molybdenum cofactor guanylyltransferase MobA [Pseudomonadota bacterium]